MNGSAGLRAGLVLTSALIAVSAVAASVTFWSSSVLSGPAVMNGSARGTALVLLGVALPLTAVSAVLAFRGSMQAVVVWIGGLAYLTYNSVLFVFATPFNQLFPVYVAMLSLSFWALVVLLTNIEPGNFRGPRLPVRAIAGYIWLVVGLNTLVWLRSFVPALFDARPTSYVDGMGVATNPVIVQDLAIWLPAGALAALWLWQRRSIGVLLAGAALVFWTIEAVGVAVDQWFGHRADPSSALASSVAVALFASVFVIGLVPLWLYFRALETTTEPATAAQPPMAHEPAGNIRSKGGRP